MQSSLAVEIRQELRRFLEGKKSLQAFQEWFASRTWNIEESEDRSAQDLAYEIELRLAEFSNGHWTMSELRELLKLLVKPSATLH